MKPPSSSSLLALPPALVLAAAAPQAAAAPPPGQLLASMCAQCHGTNGRAVSGISSISGKNSDEMYKTLLERSQRRAENIMDLQARAFTPAQLRKIADYLATQPAGTGDE